MLSTWSTHMKKKTTNKIQSNDCERSKIQFKRNCFSIYGAYLPKCDHCFSRKINSRKVIQFAVLCFDTIYKNNALFYVVIHITWNRTYGSPMLAIHCRACVIYRSTIQPAENSTGCAGNMRLYTVCSAARVQGSSV